MLQRVFIFLLLLLILPDIYLYRMYIIHLIKKKAVRYLYWIPSLLLLSGVIYLIYFTGNNFADHHPEYIGCYAVLFFLIVSPKLIFTLCSLIGLPFNKWLHWPKKPFICAGFVLGGLNAAMILYGSLIGKTQFEIKEVTFTSTQLPKAFNGYRIVQLSDIHIGSWKGNTKAIQEMVDLVNAQHPDLIVFTGDLVNNRATELNEFQTILSGLKARDGVYSVLGNHDYGPYYRWKTKREQAENLAELKKREADMGWKLLNNEHIILKAGNDSIALIGVENEGEPPFSQHGDLSKAIHGTEGMFQLLLSHNPSHWRREVLPASEVNLMLAGHTHAMQTRIGNHSPASLVYPEWAGMYQKGERSLYVNVGIGYVGMPFRFGAWPEITVLTLQR